MIGDSQDPQKTSARTLEYYDRRAEQFWQGTRDHDVSQNIAALLQYIEGAPHFTLLGFGCGPGRDLKALAARGHVAIGLEGAARLAAMARAYRDARCGSRISSRSICRPAGSMACSPTRPCSTCRAAHCRMS
jgi:hypothetical protein